MTRDKYRILIVDDEKANLDVLNHILGDHYVVYIAKSGRAALRKSRENLPDLIVLDILMPDMDGFEVIRHLKASEETQAIPVVFITGLNSVENEEKGLRLGAVDYITKPFTPAVVRARIRTQLKIIEQISMIEEMELIDAATGIPNRKRFDHQLRVEWGRAFREKKTLSLLLVQTGRLKNASSDTKRPLDLIADTCQSLLKRPADMLSRINRDTLGIILPNTDEKGARHLSAAILDKLEFSLLSARDDFDVRENAGPPIVVLSTLPEKDDSFRDFQSEIERRLDFNTSQE